MLGSTTSKSVQRTALEQETKLKDTVVEANNNAGSSKDSVQGIETRRRGSFVVKTTEEGKIYSHNPNEGLGLKVNTKSGGESTNDETKSSESSGIPAKHRGSITERRKSLKKQRKQHRDSLVTEDRQGESSSSSKRKVIRASRRERLDGSKSTKDYDVSKILSIEQLRHLLNRIPDERSEASHPNPILFLIEIFWGIFS